MKSAKMQQADHTVKARFLGNAKNDKDLEGRGDTR